MFQAIAYRSACRYGLALTGTVTRKEHTRMTSLWQWFTGRGVERQAFTPRRLTLSERECGAAEAWHHGLRGRYGVYLPQHL